MKPGHENVTRGFGLCRGQAMIESCIVIVFLCLLFLGLFQLAHAYVAREVLYHAAARSARARTVGFNRWMVEKTARVAAIPNAGPLTQPVVPGVDQTLANALATMQPGAFWDFALRSTPTSPTVATELARIPEYLASENEPRGRAILDYANWNTISAPEPTIGPGVVIDPAAAALITATVSQPQELLLALGDLAQGILTAADTNQDRLTLTQQYTIEDHYSLYIDDTPNW